MDPTEPRYSLRSSARKNRPLGSETDGDFLLDDVEYVQSDQETIPDDELPSSPETPTPGPRPDRREKQKDGQHQAGIKPEPPNENDAAEEPAPVLVNRPVRRVLFPDAPSNSNRSLPLMGMFRSPAGTTTTTNKTKAQPFVQWSAPAAGTSSSLLSQSTPFASASGARSAVPAATFSAVAGSSSLAVSHPSIGQGPAGGFGDGVGSALDPLLLGPLPSLATFPRGNAAGAAAAAADCVNPLLGGGYLGAGSLGGDLGYVSAREGGVQNAYFNLNNGGQGSTGLENRVGQANPFAPVRGPVWRTPAGEVYEPAAFNGLPAGLADWNTHVPSTVVNPGDPYAAFLRANSGLLSGNGAGSGAGASQGSQGWATSLSAASLIQPTQHPAHLPVMPVFSGTAVNWPTTSAAASFGSSSTAFAQSGAVSATATHTNPLASFFPPQGDRLAADCPTTATLFQDPEGFQTRTVRSSDIDPAIKSENPLANNRALQPTFPQHNAESESDDSDMRYRKIAPAPVPTEAQVVAEAAEENAKSVEYQLLQLKVRNLEEAGEASTQATRTEAPAADGQNITDMDNQADVDNLSTVAHMDQEMGLTDSANDGDESSVSSDEDDDDNTNNNNPRAAHVPDVAEQDVYNPDINPAAAYWVSMPAPPLFNEHGLLHRPQPTQVQPLNMYANIPAFDTDPFLPFAPWRVNQLPPFLPEPANRVLTVRRRYLAAVGALYPDSVFLVSRHPGSANFTVRMKGSALAQSVALHFPRLVRAKDIIGAAGVDGRESDEEKEEGEEKYVLALVQRDWPIGTVALLPNTPEAREFMTELQEAFDMLPGGQEQFYFLPCDEAGSEACVASRAASRAGAGAGTGVGSNNPVITIASSPDPLSESDAQRVDNGTAQDENPLLEGDDNSDMLSADEVLASINPALLGIANNHLHALQESDSQANHNGTTNPDSQPRHHHPLTSQLRPARHHLDQQTNNTNQAHPEHHANNTTHGNNNPHGNTTGNTTLSNNTQLPAQGEQTERKKPRGMYTCRAYEGRKGPQHPSLVRAWIEQQGRAGMVDQDLLGREMLTRMGEAWIEPERWPRFSDGLETAAGTRAGRAGGSAGRPRGRGTGRGSGRGRASTASTASRGGNRASRGGRGRGSRGGRTRRGGMGMGMETSK